MKHVILMIVLAVLKESYPLNPEILKYDVYMKDFEDTGRQMKQEKNEVMNPLIVKREDQKPQSMDERILPFQHNKTAYPIMNSSWCEDLSECCPFEYLSNTKFTEMLTEFCFDHTYGFMGVKDAGVDEEKERAEFKGPKEYTNLQIDQIVEAVTEALAEKNDTKKQFLTNPLFYCPHRGTERCYWKVYKIFSLMCLDLLYVDSPPRGMAKIQKLFKDRHKTEQNTSLAQAWQTHEIEDALTNMGYNFTFCRGREWKKFIPKEHKEDAKFRREVRRLCQRYLFPNDADRLEAKKRYQAQVGRVFKLEELTQSILKRLSEYNETQEKILNDKKFVINDENMDCYWKVYYSFAQTCADPHFDFRVQRLRNIFANACSASWLDQSKIIQCFKEVCPTVALYSR